MSYESLPFEFNETDTSSTIFLGPGEHSFEFLVGNEGLETDQFGVDLRVRGPNGVTSILDEGFVYTEA